MELEKWRLASKGNQGELAKNNSGNNIIGDQITAEKTANHIMNYPKWDCKKIIEQTLPYSLSLKCSNKKSSFTKYSSLQDVLAPSINELNSTHSPLSAPPLQYQRLEVQPNNVEGASNSINNTSFTSINPINPITIEDVPTTDNPTNPTTTEDVPITNIDTIPSNSLTVPELSNTLNSPNTPNTIN
ncbi:hypothetical protein BCR32DRAFT_247627 [Anaeromyces robustus]|uniref:Uncharacterized protein n=1 Tax=Anaeromyces robustus TaxID=1754192 RepID=A0A1Y1WWB5_9FUNG|nr:hypothetical protein BCR32DRAFT_247627 [Anaeromyces robustus]|eukprot:ORX77820.1 hypothetical protein BCR32DRAFT_247627 [Anaeromyces robustus]